MSPILCDWSDWWANMTASWTDRNRSAYQVILAKIPMPSQRFRSQLWDFWRSCPPYFSTKQSSMLRVTVQCDGWAIPVSDNVGGCFLSFGPFTATSFFHVCYCTLQRALETNSFRYKYGLHRTVEFYQRLVGRRSGSQLRPSELT